MAGETFFWPSATFFSETNFESAYFLAGWNVSEAWRIAGRYEWFQTAEYNPRGNFMSEHGSGLTFAVNYLPNNWLRVTGEYLRVISTRTYRTLVPDKAKADENQFQLSVRFYIP